MYKKLETARRHVIDDTWELIKAKNLVGPLISSPSLRWLKADTKEPALFLRMQLTRQVILILTRLNALPGSGKTGETASIPAVLNEASSNNIISQQVTQAYFDRLSAMKPDISNQGTSFEDLVTFRNSELAHSLHTVRAPPNALSYFVISQFADATIDLINSIETDFVRAGCSMIVADIKGCEAHWAKCGSDFWSALAK